MTSENSKIRVSAGYTGLFAKFSVSIRGKSLKPIGDDLCRPAATGVLSQPSFKIALATDQERVRTQICCIVRYPS